MSDHIVVIGAGMAGLTAARQLVDAGHRVVVFEQSHVPGGRVATRHLRGVELPRRGTVDLAFDHGAQYFTVRDARFAGTVGQWERQRLVAKWTGRIVSFDGEGWEEVAPGTDRYVGVPGMSAIGETLASGLDVRYGTRVTALARDGDRWVATASDGPALGAFDRAIVAVPAPQAVALLTAAPALAARAGAVCMKPCWTALAAFEEPAPSRFDAAFVSGSPLAWIARNQTKPGRGRTESWVLQATHDWSAAHLEDRPDTVGPFLIEAFETLVRGAMPRPFSLTAHRWRFALAEPPRFDGALRDDALRIAVCGDWCAGSRIEGAYLSGVAAAIPG